MPLKLIPADFTGSRYRSKWSIKAHFWRVVSLYSSPFCLIPIFVTAFIETRWVVLSLLLLAIASIVVMAIGFIQTHKYDSKQSLLRTMMEYSYGASHVREEDQEALDWAKEYDARKKEQNKLFVDPFKE